MTQALARTEEQPRAVLTKSGLDESAEQLRLLENYVRSVLHQDEDYGVIPGTNGKPTLLKPGAANLIAAFNCHIDGDDKCALEIMDPEKGKYGFVAYRIVVRIVTDSGVVKAMGQGSCNSYESKYRYRNASPLCPSCSKENIRKSNRGDGYYCWAKTGGCGATFPEGDQRITNQAIGKVENENPFEQANTILKMAIKRATVDAALQLPGVARFFTQDLEDMQAAPAEEAKPPAPAAASAKPAQANVGTSAPITRPAAGPRPVAPPAAIEGSARVVAESGQAAMPAAAETPQRYPQDNWARVCPVHNAPWQEGPRGHWHGLSPTGTCERTTLLTKPVRDRITAATTALGMDAKAEQEWWKNNYHGHTWSTANTDERIEVMEALEREERESRQASGFEGIVGHGEKA